VSAITQISAPIPATSFTYRNQSKSRCSRDADEQNYSNRWATPTSNEQHNRLIEIIAARDGGAAEALMESHIMSTLDDTVRFHPASGDDGELEHPGNSQMSGTSADGAALVRGNWRRAEKESIRYPISA